MSQNLKVADLDFDRIKNNLIEYMRSKPEFSDYDFTGSGLNVIINLLAYNTHYNGVIAHMLAGESFLDTATKRETVALHASRLGYVPGSAKSPQATVRMEVFPTDNVDTVTLRRGSVFNAVAGNVTLNFVNLTAQVAYKDTNGRYILPSVDLYEGTLAQFKYLVNTNAITQKFEIPSKNVDITTLSVKVQKSTTNTELTVFTKGDDIIGINGEDTAFFLKLNEVGLYEVYFGDGIIGKAIEDGNVVILDYLITNKTVGNGISKFTFADNVDGYTNVSLTTTRRALGGAEPESIESIRKTAISSVSSQNRAVTAKDFMALVPKLYPIESINAWGGEENVPPLYGKVFLSMKLPGTTDKISEDIKAEIKRRVDEKKIMAIQTEIVDPEYIFVSLDIKVAFNPNKTPLTAGSIEQKVFLSVRDYLNGRLNTFASSFRYSSLLAFIDSVDESINSNSTTLKVKKVLYPEINTSVKYTVDFSIALSKGTIYSTGLRVPNVSSVLYMDDLNGVLNLFYTVNGNRVQYAVIGTIDYSNGIINIPNLTIESIEGANTLDVFSSPVSLDINPKRNTILSFATDDIKVSSEISQG